MIINQKRRVNKKKKLLNQNLLKNLTLKNIQSQLKKVYKKKNKKKIQFQNLLKSIPNQRKKITLKKSSRKKILKKKLRHPLNLLKNNHIRK